jgi:hypothetical protein
MNNDTRKIVQYALCTAPSDTELVNAVNKAIQLGFEPFGNIATVVNQKNQDTLIQPVVKYARPPSTADHA